MERDEAVGALRDLFEARDKMRNLIQGGYDDYAKEAEEAFVEIRERILAALTQEPNQPKGEGEHTLLTKVYLSTNNVACHSYEVKTFPGGISLGLSDYITGHYEPITEKN